MLPLKRNCCIESQSLWSFQLRLSISFYDYANGNEYLLQWVSNSVRWQASRMRAEVVGQSVTGWFVRTGAAVRPSAGVVTLALSPFVPAAALLGARFRAESSCLLPDPNGNLDPEAPSPANMGRRRSRAVLYQLSGHYKPDKTKSKLKLNNVSKVPQLLLYIFFCHLF